MAQSLRTALAGLGQSGAPDGLRAALPGAFAPHTPGLRTSLLGLTASMSNPLSKWWNACEKKHADDWTRQCEGVTHDGTFWYMTSNYGNAQAIYRLDHDCVIQASGTLTGLRTAADGFHVGDLDYYEGSLYVAIQNPHGVAVVDAQHLTVTRFLPAPADLASKDTFPWCAVNPENQLIYTSLFGGGDEGVASVLYAMELTNPLKRVPSADIALQPSSAAAPYGYVKIQGGAFSGDGLVVLSSDLPGSLYGFSSLNGHFFGSAAIQKDESGDPLGTTIQEVEGVCYIPRTVSCDDTGNQPVTAQVHVILLDNRAASEDAVWFKHYAFPEPLGSVATG